MSSIADLSRPSSWLLLTLVGMNAALAIAQLGHGGPGNARNAVPAPIVEPRLVRPVERVAAVTVHAPAKRVALREPAPVCRAWGPFAELSEAESLADRLGLHGDDFEVFQSEVAASPDYLVTVEAPGSRDAAERAMRELESQRVDSYILERDSAGSVLAVGVFSAEDRAEAQRQRVAALGYRAAVEPLDRSQRIYHLLARVPADEVPQVPPLGACGDIAPMQQFL